MAIQYGGNIDEVVERLGTRNNGLYTNEWLLGDAKNNEVAMYELGTNHAKLWRSSKNEWFGDTPGFYWGDNNAKDLAIRLETQPDPHGTPEYVPYVPGVRDLAWQDLYRQYRGQIDEQFAFLAFRTAPLVSARTMDAKIVTADLASRLMLWAAIGKPNQREWRPNPGGYAGNNGLYPSGYYLFGGELSAKPGEPARMAAQPPARTSYKDRLWKGWILPASDADTWFAAGSVAYYRALQSGDLAQTLDARRAMYRGTKLGPDNPANRFRLEETKGVLFLDSLRRKLGDDRFFALMSEFFTAHAGATVTAQSFLEKAGVPFEFSEPEDGPAYLLNDIYRHLPAAILVYGTGREAGANRYATERIESDLLDDYESAVPIYKDFEVSDELLRHRDVIFVGRPETNSALAAWAGRIGLDYPGAAFRIENAVHASEREALLLAAKNPLDAAHMVLVVAGNTALRTVKAWNAGLTQADHVILK
jgi:hypothetical protein